MKKCPNCLKSDEDTVRYCKLCNTEMFFEYRFGKGGKVPLFKRILHKITRNNSKTNQTTEMEK
ncbi:MAG: hypothetical protein FWD44_09430 [Oscillospiraceae bacterium]|nr:hypothetical protein [Oscillospiraceae bacterium]